MRLKFDARARAILRRLPVVSIYSAAELLLLAVNLPKLEELRGGCLRLWHNVQILHPTDAAWHVIVVTVQMLHGKIDRRP